MLVSNLPSTLRSEEGKGLCIWRLQGFPCSSVNLRSHLKDAACVIRVDQSQGKNGLSCQLHTKLPRATPSLLAVAFLLQLPGFPISLLGQQSPPGSLPAMLSCADNSPAQMGSGEANMKGQRRCVCHSSTDLGCVRRGRAGNLHRDSDI